MDTQQLRMGKNQFRVELCLDDVRPCFRCNRQVLQPSFKIQKGFEILDNLSDSFIGSLSNMPGYDQRPLSGILQTSLSISHRISSSNKHIS